MHLQTQQEVRLRMTGMALRVVRSDGLLALYNGLSASLCRQVPLGGLPTYRGRGRWDSSAGDPWGHCPALPTPPHPLRVPGGHRTDSRLSRRLLRRGRKAQGASSPQGGCRAWRGLAGLLLHTGGPAWDHRPLQMGTLRPRAGRGGCRAWLSSSGFVNWLSGLLAMWPPEGPWVSQGSTWCQHAL